MGSLDGKVIAITGASRGLGEAMAIGFAREGAALTLAARTTSDLERVASLCKEAGAGSVTVIPTDITAEDEVVSLVERVVADNGRLDVFVANAGSSYASFTDKRYAEITSYDRDIIEKIFQVNVIGTWLCMKAALPAMSEGGSFITIGSETGRALYPGAGFYAVSKATLDAISTLAARESAERKIRVNVLSPGGMVDTKLFGPAGMPDWLKERVPPLPASVIVGAAIWLASDDSSDVTGALISGKEFDEKGAEQIRAAIPKPAARHH